MSDNKKSKARREIQIEVARVNSEWQVKHKMPKYPSNSPSNQVEPSLHLNGDSTIPSIQNKH